MLRLGNVPRESVLAAVRKADAFIHPAPWDNYPNAVLEAMAVGAACVVSDQGGQAEMVEDQDILTRLKALGVSHAQGFGIHEPQPITRFAAA